MGWVEGRDGVVAVVCVGSVRDGKRGHGMCVVIVCVGPVWGLMVGVDDDGRQRWMLSVGLFGCLCGVVAMLRLCCVWVWVCGVWCDGIVCVWLVVWSVLEVTGSELRAQRRSGLGWSTCHR